LAKECAALIERGSEDLAKNQQKEQEKMRLLPELAELFKSDWLKPKRMEARFSRGC
jgi:hypothetical protein